MKIPQIGFFSLCTLLLSGTFVSCSKSDKPAPGPKPVAGFTYVRINSNFILPQFQLTDTSKNATEWHWDFNGYAAPSTVQSPLVTFYRINKEVNATLTVKNGTEQSTKTVSFNTGVQTRHIASYTFPAANIYEDFSNNDKPWTSEKKPTSDVGVNGKSSSGKFVAADSTYVRPPLDLLNTAFDASKQISVSMWVNVNDLNNQGGILGLANGTFSYYIPAIFYADNKFYGRWPGSQLFGHIVSPAITANTWYHIVLNGDGNNHKHEMFINGVSVGTQDDEVNFGTGSNTMLKAYIGWANTQGWPVIGNGPVDKYFSGNIGAVRFFNRVITQEEVNVLYHEFD